MLNYRCPKESVSRADLHAAGLLNRFACHGALGQILHAARLLSRFACRRALKQSCMLRGSFGDLHSSNHAPNSHLPNSLNPMVSIFLSSPVIAPYLSKTNFPLFTHSWPPRLRPQFKEIHPPIPASFLLLPPLPYIFHLPSQRTSLHLVIPSSVLSLWQLVLVLLHAGDLSSSKNFKVPGFVVVVVFVVVRFFKQFLLRTVRFFKQFR